MLRAIVLCLSPGAMSCLSTPNCEPFPTRLFSDPLEKTIYFSGLMVIQ